MVHFGNVDRTGHGNDPLGYEANNTFVLWKFAGQKIFVYRAYKMDLGVLCPSDCGCILQLPSSLFKSYFPGEGVRPEWLSQDFECVGVVIIVDFL